MKNHVYYTDGRRGAGLLLCLFVCIFLTGGCGPGTARKTGPGLTAQEAVEKAVFTLQQKEISNFKYLGVNRRDGQFLVELAVPNEQAPDAQKKALVFISDGGKLLKVTDDEGVLEIPTDLPGRAIATTDQAEAYVLATLVPDPLRPSVQVAQSFRYKSGWFVFFQYDDRLIPKRLTVFVDDDKNALVIPGQ